MEKNQKGFTIPFLVIVALFVLGGCYYYLQKNKNTQVSNPISQAVQSNSTTSSDLTSSWQTYEGYGISFKYPASMGNPAINKLSTGTEIGFGQMSVSFSIGKYYDQNLGRLKTFDEVVSDALNKQNATHIQKTNMIVGGKKGIKIDYEDAISGGGTTEIFVPSGDSEANILRGYEYGRGASNEGLTTGLEQILPTFKFINVLHSLVTVTHATSAQPLEVGRVINSEGTINLPTLSLKVVVLDGINVGENIDTQVREAVTFVNKFYGVKINYSIVISPSTHGFTKYDGCENNTTSSCTVVVNQQDLATSTRQLLKDADIYALYWKSFPYSPLQAGSTWGPSMGIVDNKGSHPYTTIPVDIWWYLDDSQIGFSTRGAQILTHELVNSLYTLAEAKPTLCKNIPTTDTNLDSYKFESVRLKSLYNTCGYTFLK